MSGERAFSSSEEEMGTSSEEQHEEQLVLRATGRKAAQRRVSEVSRNYAESGGPITVLPPEVMCLIFSYLGSKTDRLSIALTCRYWAELIMELIWFRPGISNEKVYRKLGDVMAQPRSSLMWDYRQYIKRLNLSLVPQLVTDKYLTLFTGSTNLERITLVNCTKIGSQAVADLLKGCSRLQSIDLSGVRDIKDNIYLELAKNCKRLQGLYAPGSSDVSKEAVLAVVHNCPLLKRVKLSDCPGVDDEVIDELVSHCLNLVEIDVHGCTKITNGALHRMFANLEYLKEFKISKNENVTAECFMSQDGSELCLDRLRIIDFTQCPNITDDAVEKVVSLAPRLRNVVLSKCTQITDRSLRAIATLGKNLHYVHLGHCSNITDFGARELIKSCYRMQYIDLACCTQLTNATVVELAQLPKLKRIGLVKCSQITDEGIIALAEEAHKSEESLERVHLSYCINLTIYPIYKLLRAFPRLTHISLTGVSQFLRHDITQFCRDPPPEFTSHQKAIFCVFSGDGVNQLRNYLTQLIELPQDPDRETNEIMDIIEEVTETYDGSHEMMITPETDPFQQERYHVLVDSLERFVNQMHGLSVPRERLELFAKCVFVPLPAELLPRMQRFFQIFRSYHQQQQWPQQQAQQQAAAAQRRRHGGGGGGGGVPATPVRVVPQAGQPASPAVPAQPGQPGAALTAREPVMGEFPTRRQAETETETQPLGDEMDVDETTTNIATGTNGRGAGQSMMGAVRQPGGQGRQHEARMVRDGVRRDIATAIPRAPVEAELFHREAPGDEDVEGR